MAQFYPAPQQQCTVASALESWIGLGPKGAIPNPFSSTGLAVPVEHALHPAVGGSHRGLKVIVPSPLSCIAQTSVLESCLGLHS